MQQYRQYRRDLSKQQYENLQREYDFHLKDTRYGCLTTADRKHLLKLTHGPNKVSEEERRQWEADFWYRLKKKAQAAIVDMRLITDICSEDVLQEIFTHKDERKIFYQLNVFLRKLFPPLSREDSEDDDWRKYIAEEIVCSGLMWYVNSGVLSTEAHRRVVFEVLDAVSLVSSGRRRYRRTNDGGIEEVPSAS